MKQFNLRDALNGQKCFSIIGGNVIDIVVLPKVTNKDSKLAVTFEDGSACLFSENGQCFDGRPDERADLQMTPTKKSGFINVYQCGATSKFTVGDCETVFNTRDAARNFGFARYKTDNFLTIPIEFEF